MKVSVAAILGTAVLATAQRTYNITSALTTDQLEKYNCLTTETWLSEFGIPECLKDCTRYANANDGCAYDDFACHNINYQVYSDLVEPCAFPESLGGNGTCTLDELGAVRPIVADAGNFFNATLYAAYAGQDCEVPLTIFKTLEIIVDEATVVTRK